MRSNSRTHGSINRLAKPSDVTTRVSIVRERQPFRVEAGGRKRLSVRVAERRDADDLDGGSTAATPIRSV